MNYLERAAVLKDEIIAVRRHLHSIPETGLDTVKTKNYVREMLENMGIEPVEVG